MRNTALPIEYITSNKKIVAPDNTKIVKDLTYNVWLHVKVVQQQLISRDP